MPNPLPRGGKISAADQAKLDAGSTNSKAKIVVDPHNLDVVGLGALSQLLVPGARALLGGSTTQTLPTPKGTKGPLGQTLYGPRLTTSDLPDLTASETMDAFQQMSGTKLAEIQHQMYRAGDFYDSGFVPTWGTMRTQDIVAFRQMLLGFAVNPHQQDAQGNQLTFSSYLSGLANSGDQMGVNLRSKAPNVIHLTDPNALRLVLQKGAQDLYGGNLPEEDVAKFVNGYNSQEAAAKTAAYNAGEGNLGVLGAGGTVTDAPPAAMAAESFIRTNHPNEVAGNYLGNAMNNILDVFRKSA